MVVNGAGAVLTTGVLIVVAVTKFALGAWVVLRTDPGHDTRVSGHPPPLHSCRRAAWSEPDQAPPKKISQFVLVPIDDVNYASLTGHVLRPHYQRGCHGTARRHRRRPGPRRSGRR